MAVTRTEIRNDLKAYVKAFVSPSFTSYPTVNVKDYDIAGLDKPSYYPVVNILLGPETFASSPIGKSDRDMTVIIDVIPWCDEVNADVECDKVYQEFPSLLYKNPRWSSYAMDTIITSAKPLRLGTDCPSMKIRFELTIKYRESRQL